MLSIEKTATVQFNMPLNNRLRQKSLLQHNAITSPPSAHNPKLLIGRKSQDNEIFNQNQIIKNPKRFEVLQVIKEKTGNNIKLPKRKGRRSYSHIKYQKCLENLKPSKQSKNSQVREKKNKKFEKTIFFKQMQVLKYSTKCKNMKRRINRSSHNLIFQGVDKTQNQRNFDKENEHKPDFRKCFGKKNCFLFNFKG